MSNTQSDVVAFNEALVEPAPRVDLPTSLKVDLMRGFLNPLTNEWQMSAVVRELNGIDEEALAAFDVQKGISYSEYMTHMLKRGVTSVGNVDVLGRAEIIDELIIGDRDLLFLGVLKATYGRHREFRVSCRECGGSNDVTMDLETDFKMEKPKHNLHETMKVTLKNGTVVELTYPTGGDSQVASKKGKTTAEQNTHILSRCVVLQGKSASEKEAWARGLSLADRNKLVKALFSAQPGPRMEEVETQCAHCNAKIVLALDWVSLLFG
jgi:hypothetical protein